MRDSIAEIIIDHFLSENEDIATRSPIDRMVISTAARTMNDRQLSLCMDAALTGMALVSSRLGATAITLIAFAKAVF